MFFIPRHINPENFKVWHQTILLGLGYKIFLNLGANSCFIKYNNVFHTHLFAMKIYNYVLHTYFA